MGIQVRTLLALGVVLALVMGCGGGGGGDAGGDTPTIGSIVPSEGSYGGGTPVTITGANFPENPEVLIGTGLAQNIVRVDSTTITCETPVLTPGMRAGVIVRSGSVAGFALDLFHVYAAPTVVGISPPTGSPGGSLPVTIAGTGFVANGAGANTVTIGGAPATGVVTISDTTISCITPPLLTGLHTVKVANANGEGSLGLAFEVGTPPILYGIERGGNSNLHIIDPLTGAGTLVGPTGAPIDSIAIDPTTGSMYGTSVVYGVAGASDLFSIDVNTGAAAFIGPVGTPVWDLAFAPDGRLIGMSPFGQAILIDLTTGTGSPLASGLGEVAWATSTWPSLHGGFSSVGGDFFYVPGQSQAFGGGSPSAPRPLLRVDPDAGSVTSVGPMTGMHSVRGMGTLAGTLYAINSTQLGNNQGSGDANIVALWRVDEATGTPVLIGTLPGNMSSIAGNTP